MLNTTTNAEGGHSVIPIFDEATGAVCSYWDGVPLNGIRISAVAMSGVRTICAVGALTALTGAALAATTVPASVTPPGAYHLISTSTAPTPPEPLPPNDQGYVRVTTASPAIGCSITSDLVACETSSENWPRHSDGRPYHSASVSSDGEFHLVDGDLGTLEGKVALSARMYWAQGWTITAGTDAITFTNDRTGRGMRVSPQAVQAF